MDTAPLNLWTRSLGETTELYLTARPGAGGAATLFPEIADALRARSARILLERIFLQGEDPDRLEAIRRRAYGELDDGVTPTWLGSPADRRGELAGVLIHAVAGAAPEAIGRHLRVLRHPRGRLVALAGLATAPGRASALFAEAAALLESQGANFARAARTWIWVDPIARHYAELNRARTHRYREAGLIPDRAGAPSFLPASTGIGLRPRGGGLCLEAIAFPDGPAPVAWLGSGNQRSAFAYGSAFSRATRIEGPTGPTVFVSGTAAIDGDGRTIAPDAIEEQIASTVGNLRAVLRDLSVEEASIVQGVAYARRAEVAEAWQRSAPGWPLCTVLADICRPDLCFEVELTACPPLREPTRGG